MKPKRSRLPLRMLVLVSLCAAPLMVTATGILAGDIAESDAPARQGWLSKASSDAWAGEYRSFSASHGSAVSFADGARERSPGPHVGGGDFSRDGSAAQHSLLKADKWSPDFLSESPGSASALVGVTTPVPEPETYALMAAGLALVGFVLRRRRRS